ncbi:hypothetical protein [Bosea rubneri]|uniref:Uncharacterized protein n=1 Tax=Bosea rubneri TaxID=3075434 RepID=A0ABU3SDF2_9HYPH|nr:hypothetical protein [Bosea sp. ZW T0_25]MDU0342815.1 hypothetical protein [Bosea sp. ZW T0_25]
MFSLSRSAIASNTPALLAGLEAALVAVIVFGAGLAFAVTIGFF